MNMRQTEAERVTKEKASSSKQGLALDAERISKQVDEIANAIVTLRRYFSDKLIVLMLNDATKVSRTDIQAILEALPDLPRIYLKARKS